MTTHGAPAVGQHGGEAGSASARVQRRSPVDRATCASSAAARRRRRGPARRSRGGWRAPAGRSSGSPRAGPDRGPTGRRRRPRPQPLPLAVGRVPVMAVGDERPRGAGPHATARARSSAIAHSRWVMPSGVVVSAIGASRRPLATTSRRRAATVVHEIDGLEVGFGRGHHARAGPRPGRPWCSRAAGSRRRRGRAARPRRPGHGSRGRGRRASRRRRAPAPVVDRVDAVAATQRVELAAAALGSPSGVGSGRITATALSGSAAQQPARSLGVDHVVRRAQQLGQRLGVDAGAQARGTGPGTSRPAWAVAVATAPSSHGMRSYAARSRVRSCACDAPPLRGSDAPLWPRRYDVALLDLDGVVYVGPDAVPGAPQALARRAATACGWRSSPTTPPARRTRSPPSDRTRYRRARPRR